MKRTALLLGAVTLMVMTAVVLVLVFTVFKDGDKKDGGEAAEPFTPSATIEEYYRAMEEQDLEALIAVINPSYIGNLEEKYGRQYRDFIEGYFLESAPYNLQIEGLDLLEDIKGDRAAVTVVGGTFTYTDDRGERVTKDLFGETVADFQLVKKGGTWYIAMTSFPDWKDYLKQASRD